VSICVKRGGDIYRPAVCHFCYCYEIHVHTKDSKVWHLCYVKYHERDILLQEASLLSEFIDRAMSKDGTSSPFCLGSVWLPPNEMYGKGKVVPVLNLLSTKP
jgi:hypothetical protein